jgi:Nif-specific regulatory protein
MPAGKESAMCHDDVGVGRRQDLREGERKIPEESMPATLGMVEKEMIVVALHAAQGNKAKAVRALGISKRLMGLRVNKYGIEPQAFRTRK